MEQAACSLCLPWLLLPTLTPGTNPWSQDLSLTLGSETVNSPSVDLAFAPGPAVTVRGPVRGSNSRRACLQPSPFPYWPSDSRKVFSPLSVSLHWDAVWDVLLLLLWLVSWIGLGVPRRVSSNQVGPLCLGSVPMCWQPHVLAADGSSVRATQQAEAGGGKEPWVAACWPSCELRAEPSSVPNGCGEGCLPVYMGLNSSTHLFSECFLSCYRPGTALSTGDTAGKRGRNPQPGETQSRETEW